MKPIDDVFQLTKSLTKNEKRFFKMYSQLTEGNKNYIKLFDLLEKEKEYNEEVIKRKLKGAKFLTNLPYEKNYLYKQLLKALRIYHADSSVKSRARTLADYAEILTHKGFVDQAIKQVKLNEKNLKAIDDISQLIVLSDQQEGIFNRMGSRISEDEWGSFFTRREKLLHQAININAYKRLEREVLTMNAVELMKPGKKSRAMLDKIRNHPLMNKDKKLDSFDVSFRYNMINALLALYEYDYIKEAHYFKKILELLNEFPDMKEAYHKEYYLSAHYNYNVALLLARDYKTVRSSIIEFRNNCQTSSRIKNALAFFFVMNNETDLSMGTGDLKQANIILKEMETGIPVHAKYFSDVYWLHFRTDKATLLFLTGNHKACVTLLTELLNEFSGTEHRDKNIFIRLLLILNYYELQKYDLVEYILGSTDRLLKKMDRVYKTEKLLLDFFRKLKSGKKIPLASFKELQSKLEVVLKDKEEAATIFHFDYTAWIDSKIQNTSFANVLSLK